MILVVCTGNLHRSPVLEAILKKHGFGAVSSAGLESPGGEAPLILRQAASEQGLDLREHRSRQVTKDLLVSSRLIICMQRDHIARIALLDPTAFRKTLMLREAVHIMQIHPPHPGILLEAWLATTIGNRRPSDVLSAPESLETPDPIGGSPDDFRESVADISKSADQLIAGLSYLVPRND